MDHFLSPRPGPGQLAQAMKDLDRCNEVSGRYGLVLSQPQMLALTECRFQALATSGRVEFGNGILKDLILTFCPSPYLGQADYESTLAQLQDLFYHFKNETHEQLTDSELLEAMRAIFDGPANGSTEYLSGTAPELLLRVVRDRGLAEEGPDDE